MNVTPTVTSTAADATRGPLVPQPLVRRPEARVPKVLFATLMKDLRLEWRSKDAINSMLFFALLVVVVFSFSFDPTGDDARRIAGSTKPGRARFATRCWMPTEFRLLQPTIYSSPKPWGTSYL